MNIELFFDYYRSYFGRIKDKRTVDNIKLILEKAGSYNVTPPQLAYILASIRHEAGSEMLPITENLNYSARRLCQVWPSRFPTIDLASQFAFQPEKLGNFVYGGRLGNGPKEGYKYRGHGHIQITGKINYKKFQTLLNIDIVNNPELVLEPEISVDIAILGMLNGLFTGQKLSDYIKTRKIDFVNARAIVNADVKRVGHKIAKDAELFLAILSKV